MFNQKLHAVVLHTCTHSEKSGKRIMSLVSVLVQMYVLYSPITGLVDSHKPGSRQSVVVGRATGGSSGRSQ